MCAHVGLEGNRHTGRAGTLRALRSPAGRTAAGRRREGRPRVLRTAAGRRREGRIRRKPEGSQSGRGSLSRHLSRRTAHNWRRGGWRSASHGTTSRSVQLHSLARNMLTSQLCISHRGLAARLRRVAIWLRIAGGGGAVGVSIRRLLLSVTCTCDLHGNHTWQLRVRLRSACKATRHACGATTLHRTAVTGCRLRR